MMRTFGNLLHKSREVTVTTLQLHHAKKTCKGPCRRSRSVGQFAVDDALCMMCRRRTVSVRGPQYE